MDRRRAAGALLALAACIASSAAAPTSGNHTALDLYDEHTEGCYYNFQHYGEGDRIMTNEPCLNCTCHNRMLMCYLRVCPFTKAIGQDCTVEKRADQCCPIVTCPDVPVDLLTSTSTSSPAEYGGTGVGKVDNYGCTINGKYFPEGSKVPPTPNKPCEHCYCIRNMTTCVMQECTLHVDGCTPIYHKDVCCPVRYFCDHPEDELPALDDMTTTVRPTQGFLLTTTPPTEEPTTLPAKRDCIEDDQLYPDGALIKRDKPCEHCYCMKGDIVCVVQECGTPMENEGKNCTSLPPREGQCCPDTYICDGDELSPDLSTGEPFAETTTFVPPRRVSIEGSGYRNEPDEVPYTEVPTFATEIEGSGEDELIPTPDLINKIKPEDETTDKDLFDRYGPTEESEFIPETTQSSILGESEKPTTEPDKGLNTIPSEISEDERIAPSLEDQTTPRSESKVTKPISEIELETSPSVVAEAEGETKPTMLEQTTFKYETKATAPTLIEDQTTVKPIVSTDLPESEGSKPETTPNAEEKITEPPFVSELEAEVTEPATVSGYAAEVTKPAIISEQDTEGTTPVIIDEHVPEATQPAVVTELELEVTEPSVVSDHKPEVTEKAVVSELEPEVTEPAVVSEQDKEVTESSIVSEQGAEVTKPVVVSDHEAEVTEPATLSDNEAEVTKPSVVSEHEAEMTEPTAVKNHEPEVTEPAIVSDHEAEVTEPASVSDHEAEVTEPASVIDRVAEVTEPASVIDHEAEVTEPASVSDQVAEVTEPASVSDHVAEVTEPASVSDHEAEVTEPASVSDQVAEVTEPASVSDHEAEVTEPASVSDHEAEVTEPASVSDQVAEVTEPASVSDHVAKVTEPASVSDRVAEVTEPASIGDYEAEVTTPSVVSEPESEAPIESDKEKITETPIVEPSLEESKTTELPSPSSEEIEKETSESSFATTTEKESEIPEHYFEDSRRTSPVLDMQTTERTSDTDKYAKPSVPVEESTELVQPLFEQSTTKDGQDVTEPTQTSEQNTIAVRAEEEQTTEPPKVDKFTPEAELTFPSTSQEALAEESIKPSITEKTTISSDAKTTDMPVHTGDEELPKPESTTNIPKVGENSGTTVPAFRKEDETTTSIDISTQKDIEEPLRAEVTKETVATPGYEAPTTEVASASQQPEPESKPTTTLQEQQEIDETTQAKDVTTESFMELSTFAHVTEKESATSLVPGSEIVPTTSNTEVTDLPENITINPEDNEIDEVPSPGRIPGEGDCLLDGITYKNDSVVPSNNKCHSACKCLSSIVKCDPIICSPPPEYMDNCQPRYDTPESCCPTYICDHRKETIPPQSHSQMSGTESPLPSPSIECDGDQCEDVGEKVEPTYPPKIPERIGPEDCGSEGCKDSAQKPVPAYPEGCQGDKCSLPTEPCIEDNCKLPLAPTDEQPQPTPAMEISQPCNDLDGCKDVEISVLCKGDSCLPEITPPKDITQVCENEGDCKESKIPETSPLPCEGVSCPGSQDQLCDGEKCAAEPESIPSKDIPQLCENEDDCKQIKVPEVAARPCEGDLCINVKEDCNTGECKIVTTSTPQTNQQSASCSEESGCKKPEETTIGECKDGYCEDKESEDRVQTECTSDECLQQKPSLPSQETAPSVTESADLPEQATSQPTVSVEEIQTTELPFTSLDEKISNIPEQVTTEVPEKAIKEHVPSAVDKTEKQTETPVQIITDVPELTTEKSVSELPGQEQEMTEKSQEEAMMPEHPLTEASPEDGTVPTNESEIISPELSVTEIPLQQDIESKPMEEEPERSPDAIESHEIGTEESKEPFDEQKETSTKLPEEQEETQVTKLEEATTIPEVLSSDQEKSTSTTELPEKHEEETQSQKETEIVSEEPSSPEQKITELSESPEAATESAAKITEPSIYESHDIETEAPKVPIIETQTTEKTIEPAKESTPTYEIDTKPEITVVEEAQTELPVAAVTEAQEIQTDSPEGVPDRFGDNESIEMSTQVTENVETEQVQTKAPEILESEEKEHSTTDTPKATIPSKYDIDTKESSPTEVPQPDLTESETLSPEAPEETIPTQETVTKGPEEHITDTEELVTVPLFVTDEEKQTKSPLSLITKTQETQSTTVMSEILTSKPEFYEMGEKQEKTEKPELQEPEKTEPPISVPSDTDKLPTEGPYTPIPEQETITEKETELKPELELTATVAEEPITDMPESVPVLVDESSVADEEKVSTKVPAITESEQPVTEQKVTEDIVSYETESPVFEQPETSSDKATLPPPSGEEIVKATDSFEPSATEEYEISTKKPKPFEEEVHIEILHSTTSKQDLETETPEFMTPKTPIRLPEEEVTKKPEEITSDIEGNLPSVSPTPSEDEHIPTELSTSAPELEDNKKPEEKVTTQSSITSVTEEELYTETPKEFVTKAIATEAPESYATSSSEVTSEHEEIKTIAPDIHGTKPQSLEKEEPVTLLPEKAPSEEDIKEETTMTKIPEVTLEVQTDLPIAQETSAPVTTEQTEQSQIPTKQQELYEDGKQTEQPITVTEAQQIMTSEPEVIITDQQPDLHKEDELPTESNLPPKPFEPMVTESSLEETTQSPIREPSEDKEKIPEEPTQTSEPEHEYSETTPYLVILEEHTHKIDEEITIPVSSEEPTTSRFESQESGATEGFTEKLPGVEQEPELPEVETEQPSTHKEEVPVAVEEPYTTLPTLEKESGTSMEPTLTTEIPVSEEQKPIDRVGPEEDKEKESEMTTLKQPVYEEEPTTLTPSIETVKTPEETVALSEIEVTPKPQDVPIETTAPEEEFIPVTSKVTTAKVEEEVTTQPTVQLDKTTKPEEKPSNIYPTSPTPEVVKPDELQPTDDIPAPEDENQFPPSGGYNQEPDYVEEDQAFGPGTCRYGGKVYVSAQQIPRDDPCDFCFCFRSDIICLQQSCPPPIHGCHEEPIQGFCCPRYECPVSMATTLNVTTTTTTTTTTLPPHFLPHAYKGAAQRRGCQIKGHTYKVGEVVRASSGPCLHCTCGGDGQMKCDPKACTPEPMLRQMIAAAVSAKRRR